MNPFLARIVERLPDHPAVVFSASGEVLWRTRPAIALFGESVSSLLDGPAGDTTVCVRHPGLGELELHRQLLIDRADHQMLLIFTAVPGSPSEEKLRRL